MLYGMQGVRFRSSIRRPVACHSGNCWIVCATVRLCGTFHHPGTCVPACCLQVSPSDKGHAGAGNFTSAVYCLCPPTSACSQSQTPHAAHDGAVWHTLSATGEAPGPRGWFAAAVVPGAGDLLVHGGLGTENERLGDMYRLCMHA